MRTVRLLSVPSCSRIGIAEDMVQRDVTSDKRYHYSMPIEQDRPAGGAHLLLKMRGDPVLQGDAVRKALQTVMPGSSYVTVRPLREAIDGALRSWRLGAQSGDILRLVVGQGMRFAAAGVAVGTAFAFVAARWLQPLLFQQSAKDSLVYGVVAALLLLTALAASASPAWRAAKAAPNTALRSE